CLIYHALVTPCPILIRYTTLFRSVELEFLENQFLDRDQEFIECSTHGALFLVESGECISGPCQGQALEKVEITVHSDGGIYLSRSEEHTSELQSRENLVCRLLLEE